MGYGPHSGDASRVAFLFSPTNVRLTDRDAEQDHFPNGIVLTRTTPGVESHLPLLDQATTTKPRFIKITINAELRNTFTLILWESCGRASASLESQKLLTTFAYSSDKVR